MKSKVKDYLKRFKIFFKEFEHPPVHTVKESKEIKSKIAGEHTKCLFLKDNKKRFYLVAIQADKRLDTKKLRAYFNVKKLNFGSPEELNKMLKLKPGSVSIFGLIHKTSRNIILIIDEDLWKVKEVGFHPNINTSTIVLNHKNFKKFIETLDNKIEIMKL